MLVYPDEGAFSVRLTRHTKATTTEAASADQPILLDSNYNYYFTAPFYLGNNLEAFTMIYDTGSPEVVVSVKDCKGCACPTYDYTGSSTFTWTNKTESSRYGDGTKYSGMRCTEKTCPLDDPNSCISDF
jgi:hypothetical protein